MARRRQSIPTQADDPRAQRTMVALQDALLALIDSKPYDDILIREITDLAKVSYPTFFRRCADKADLLNSIAAEEVRRLLSLGQEAMRLDPENASSVSMFTYVASRRSLWKTLLTGGARLAVREEFERISESIAQDYPTADGAVPRDLAVPLVTSGIIEILTWWLRRDCEVPVQKVAGLYERLVVDSVMGHGPRRRVNSAH